MLFIFILSLIIIYFIFYIHKNKKYTHIENFSSPHSLVKNTPEEIYDKFYGEIYDDLFNSDTKNEFECMVIHKDFIKKCKNPLILDIGCGTGSHIKILSRYQHKLTGLDQSKYMIRQAIKKNKKNIDFKVGDYHNSKLFKAKTFNIILCLFYTIYYSKNLNVFFKNCNNWLKQHGYLFIHVVNKSKFDPVLDKSSSLIPFFDPQKYRSSRNTSTQLSFNKFKYQSDWTFKPKSAYFIENFNFPEISRTNKHFFYMYKQKHIIKIAEKYGFKVVKIYDEFIIGYKYNYILVLEKKYG